MSSYYLIFEPGEIDLGLARRCMLAHGCRETVPMLPYGDRSKVGWETRRLYFALALNSAGRFGSEPILRGRSTEDVRGLLPVTRIFSFGLCNVACGYCKRDCQFIGDDGRPIIAKDVETLDLFRMAEGAYARGETVRFSGGDPVMFPRETLAVSEYLYTRYGAKTSIAHNGSGPAWVKKIAPYLESAAIDLKAVPQKMGTVMGVSGKMGERLYGLSLETQAVISSAGVLMDVRTPVFGDTSLEEMVRLGADVVRSNAETTFWTWRLYKPVHGCDWPAPQIENVLEMLARVSSTYPQHWMGIRAKWEKGGMVYFLGGQRVNQGEGEDVAEERGSGNGFSFAARTA